MTVPSLATLQRRLVRRELFEVLAELARELHEPAQAEYYRLLRANAHRLLGAQPEDMLLALALAAPLDSHPRRDAETLLRTHAPPRRWVRQVVPAVETRAALWTLHDSEMGGSGTAGLAVDPEGRRVAVPGREGLIRVFDLATAASVQRLSAHRKAVTALAWTVDGTMLLSGSEDHAVAGWSRQGSLDWMSANAHRGTVRSVIELPGGRIATLGHEGALKLWSRDGRKPLASFAVGGTHAGAMVWLDGSRVATVGYQRPTGVWDVDTRTVVRELPGANGWIFAVARGPNATQLLVTGSDGTTLWDHARGERLAHFDVAGRALVVHPAGERAYVGAEDGAIWVIDLERRERIGVLGYLPHRVVSLATVPGAEQLVALDLAGWLCLWDVSAAPVPATPHELPSELIASQSHPVVFAGLGSTGWWDVERGELIQIGRPDLEARSTTSGERLYAMERARLPLLQLRDGTVLTAAGARDAKRWDVATGACLGTYHDRLQPHDSGDGFLGRLAPDGECVAHLEPEGADTTDNTTDNNTDNNVVVVWSALSNRTIQRLPHPGKVLTAIPLVDARLLSVDVSGTVRVFALDTGATLLEQAGVGGEAPRSTRVLPDGLSAVSIVGRAVARWSTVTGAVQGVVKLRGEIACIALHPDGRRVLAVDKKTLHVLDPMTGKALAKYPAVTAPLRHVLVRADGRHAVTITDGWHHALWDLEAGRCVGSWPGLNSGFSAPLEGPWWAVMPWGEPLSVIDAATGVRVAEWLLDGPHQLVTVLPDGRIALVGREKTRVLAVQDASK